MATNRQRLAGGNRARAPPSSLGHRGWLRCSAGLELVAEEHLAGLDCTCAESQTTQRGGAAAAALNEPPWKDSMSPTPAAPQPPVSFQRVLFLPSGVPPPPQVGGVRGGGPQLEIIRREIRLPFQCKGKQLERWEGALDRRKRGRRGQEKAEPGPKRRPCPFLPCCESLRFGVPRLLTAIWKWSVCLARELNKPENCVLLLMMMHLCFGPLSGLNKQTTSNKKRQAVGCCPEKSTSIYR